MSICFIVKITIWCFSLIDQIVPSLDIRSFFSWLLCPLTYSHDCGVKGGVCVCVCVFEHFIIFGTTRCFRFILYISCPVWESAISTRSPDSFHWKTVLENKIWVVGVICAHCSRSTVASRASQMIEQGKICVYTSPSIYISIRKNLCTKLNMSSYSYFQL